MDHIRAKEKSMQAEKKRLDDKARQRMDDAAAERRRWAEEDAVREAEKMAHAERERRELDNERRKREAERKAWEEKHGSSFGGRDYRSDNIPSARSMATEMRNSKVTREEEDRRWERFNKDTPSVVRMKDIPFPCEEALKGTGLSATNKKKMFKEWARRWHPDKFMQGFGNKLDVREKEAIGERVKATFQSIQASFQK